jgi:hypothetical protein
MNNDHFEIGYCYKNYGKNLKLNRILKCQLSIHPVSSAFNGDITEEVGCSSISDGVETFFKTELRPGQWGFETELRLRH